MSSRWYPIYKKGNPQRRIFLPNFWMKLVRPLFKQPTNIVQFITPTEMTDYDIKNYLEKIYKVPVAEIRSEIVEGDLKRERTKGYIIKEDDYRRAFVTLMVGEKFEFPDICKPKEEKDDEEFKKMKEQAEANFKEFSKRNVNRPGVPGWFGI
ncbi:mitochondrial ribosomal protein L23 [Rhodnius prolixus]|uniref:Large ribosomal subunit protein uL23m n=2 Tax=Rhodnius TaxID=13248 RepID=T1HK49_RHOPR